jgi:hypothetical protein
MAEQLNKLGQVLVYDSNIDLKDRSPGGAGYQATTMNNAGQFIDGTIVGNNLHFVKSNGTAAENGQALVDAYAAASAKTSLTTTLDLSVPGEDITGFQEYGPGPGDTTIPFTGYNGGNDGGFEIQTPTWDPSDLITSGYFRVILVDTAGNECDVLLDMGLKTSSYFRTSIDRIYSGTAFPMENLASIKFDKTYLIKQHVLAAPGRYLLPSIFYLNAYVDISSSDSGRSIILEENSPAIIYSYNGDKNLNDYVKISGIDGYSNQVQVSLSSNATSVTFENCSGGDNSFIHTTGTYINHTFKNCKALNSSFGSFGGSLTNCNFYNCEAGQYAFAHSLNSISNSIISNCVALQKAFISNTPSASDVWVINCLATNGYSFIYNDSATTANHNRTVIKDCNSDGSYSFGINCTFLTSRETTFDNCFARNGASFGYESTGGAYDKVIFSNCVGRSYNNFGRENYDLRVTVINGISFGAEGFQNGNNISMKLINCVTTSGTFNSILSGSGAKVMQCINSDGNFINIS